jgi:hypothetical protein
MFLNEPERGFQKPQLQFFFCLPAPMRLPPQLLTVVSRSSKIAEKTNARFIITLQN